MTKKKKHRDISRKINKYKPKQSILIVCEGFLEKNYFEDLRNELRLSTIKVDIHNAEGRENVVKYTTKLKEQLNDPAKNNTTQNSYDAIWCVFDRENFPGKGKKDKFYNYIRNAEDHHIKVAVSNRCIEYWFLLHYHEYKGESFELAKDYKTQLKQYCSSYKEEKKYHIFDDVYRNTDFAIKQARKSPQASKDLRIQELNKTDVAKHQAKADETIDQKYPNPSTTVYELVEEMQNMSAPVYRSKA